MNQIIYNNSKGFDGIWDTITQTVRNLVSSPTIYSGMKVSDFYEKLIETADYLVFLSSTYKEKPDFFTPTEVSELHSQIIIYNNLALDFREWLIDQYNVELPIIQVCNIAETGCDYRTIGTLPSLISTAASASGNVMKTSSSASTNGLGIAPIAIGIGVALVGAAAYIGYIVVNALTDRLLPTAQATQTLYNNITERGLDLIDKCISGEVSTEQCNQAYDVLNKFSQLGEEGRNNNILSKVDPTKIILGAVGIVAGAGILYGIIKKKL